ncbi:MAG: M28 family peptidase [Gammaproteobacteria bacterium]|nr:M28 family peptidase [Gammaproteobacteria bacterium]
MNTDTSAAMPPRNRHWLASLAVLSVALGLAACQPATDGEADKSTDPLALAKAIDVDRIRAHMTFLSADPMRGREANTEQYDIAANYTAAQFELMGLEPAGTEGYMQPVTFRQTLIKPETAAMKLTQAGETRELEFGKDYVVYGSSAHVSGVAEAPLVFVGLGISAPELGHDDYAGVDVDGKIVVIMSGRPDGMPGSESAHLGSRSVKIQTAADKGAIGILYVAHPETVELYDIEAFARWAQRPSTTWLAPDGSAPTSHPSIQVRGVVAPEISRALLGVSDDEAFNALGAALKASENASRELDARLYMAVDSERSEFVSNNVVAMLPGSDPELADEYVIYSGHLDGQGVYDKAPEPEEGEEVSAEDSDKPADLIKNSAFDNALGVSMILELARTMTLLDEAPRRSMMFLFITAEEMGLLGSEHFAAYPTVPKDDIVANVNIDMPILTFEQKDVVLFGAENSSLGPLATAQAERIGYIVSPDPAPEERFFVRSDQYSFVREGVPALSIDPGRMAADPNVDGDALTDDFLLNHYHQASDSTELPFARKTAARFAGMNFLIGLAIANADERPTWNAGDFFGRTFGPDRMASGDTESQ